MGLVTTDVELWLKLLLERDSDGITSDTNAGGITVGTLFMAPVCRDGGGI